MYNNKELISVIIKVKSIYALLKAKIISYNIVKLNSQTKHHLKYIRKMNNVYPGTKWIPFAFADS